MAECLGKRDDVAVRDKPVRRAKIAYGIKSEHAQCSGTIRGSTSEVDISFDFETFRSPDSENEVMMATRS